MLDRLKSPLLMDILFITPPKWCHDQHVIDLMPLAKILSSNRDCMLLIKTVKKKDN